MQGEHQEEMDRSDVAEGEGVGARCELTTAWLAVMMGGRLPKVAMPEDIAQWRHWDALFVADLHKWREWVGKGG